MATSFFDPFDALTGPDHPPKRAHLLIERQVELVKSASQVAERQTPAVYPRPEPGHGNLTIMDRTIRIAGTKSVPYGDNASVHRRERRAGAFNRSISLPIEVDVDRVKAECRDGILALHLPRAERDKPRSISLT